MDSVGGGGNGRALQVTEFAAARALEARAPLLLRPPPRCRLARYRSVQQGFSGTRPFLHVNPSDGAIHQGCGCDVTGGLSAGAPMV